MSKLELCFGFVLNIDSFYLLECTELHLQEAVIVTWEGCTVLFQCLITCHKFWTGFCMQN